MTGSNNPYLCVGGPKDGTLMSVENAYAQVYVRERPYLDCSPYSADRPVAPIHAHSHVYHKASSAGESFLVHETLYQTSEYPRNVFARLKSNYKVFE